MIRSFLDYKPEVGAGCFIAETAVVIGNVSLGEHSSVWYNTVIRGDVGKITIGHHTNIQDLCMIHVSHIPTIIGDYVTLGHCAVVHGCTIEDNCLIGISATVLDGAVIGAESIVAAGAVVPPGMRVPPRSLVLGIPGAVKKQLADADVDYINQHWRNYVELKEQFLR
ncbi:MAG: gamma carbonic anhydrase family protein [Blastocatellia bacterium]